MHPTTATNSKTLGEKRADSDEDDSDDDKAEEDENMITFAESNFLEGAITLVLRAKSTAGSCKRIRLKPT